jgi:predicted Zn-dependent protease
VRQTQGFYPGEHVRFEHGSTSEAVVVPDRKFLAALSALAPEAARRFHDPRRRSGRLWFSVAAAILAVVIGFVLYQWGVQALATMLASAIPASWEERVGDAGLQELAPPSRVCTESETVTAIAQLSSTILAAAPGFPYTSKIVVVREDQFNALALPGARIVIYGDLLGKAETPDELAAVLAHELQHARERHSTEAALRAASVSALIGLVAGGDGAVRGLLTAASTLDQLRYSRRQEEAADRGAVAMLQRARIDARGMLRFLARAREQESTGATAVPRYLSTHPPTAERIEQLRAVIEPQRYAPTELMTAEEWAKVRTACAVRR